MRIAPLYLTLALSGSVHLGLLVLLAWSSNSALDSLNRVEIDLVEFSAPASAPAPTPGAVTPLTPVTPKRDSARRVAEPKSAAPAESASPTAYETYTSEVARELNRHKIYPDVSLRLRQEGRVKVGFSVNRQGQILRAEILEKCAHEPLNQAAKRLIDEIQAFPPFPAEVREATWRFTVAIEYTM